MRFVLLISALLLVAACTPAEEISVQEREVATTGAPETTAAPADEPADDEQTGASDGSTAADGDLVSVEYTGTLDDGTQFDSSIGRAPLEFVVGSGQVIVGFDEAVRGLAVGESRTVRIEPENAYGELDPAQIIEVPFDQLPEGVAVGDSLVAGTGQSVTVTELTDNGAMIDFNHPLAGQALTFEVELLSIG